MGNPPGRVFGILLSQGCDCQCQILPLDLELDYMHMLGLQGLLCHEFDHNHMF